MSATKASRSRAPDWVAIRRQYEKSGTMTVAEIAASHGITPSAIWKRRAAEGWQGRPQCTGGGRAFRTGRPSGTVGRAALISRLLKAVDRNLKLMEMSMESEEPGTAADRERETRAISALTRTLGKLTELQSETDPADTAAPKSGSRISADDDGEADRLRLEIAERILRLGKRCLSR